MSIAKGILFFEQRNRNPLYSAQIREALSLNVALGFIRR